VKPQSAAVEVDDDLEVVWVPIATGPSLEGHDLAVEARNVSMTLRHLRDVISVAW